MEDLALDFVKGVRMWSGREKICGFIHEAVARREREGSGVGLGWLLETILKLTFYSYFIIKTFHDKTSLDNPS